ncbi:DUF4180 domain-containing protein [Winogradskya humida]|uniref:DUF4180 domain-containing protein n=1 Tax=Winogradskya humida TaxID=113566 RepID=A0ABQ3ZKV1_9ACTN|nr:DUF4180 domain-containing protein [Actinoplanes humidus]GIE19211.1 hypothetical protein Ahu01nite_023130 [Actinoplanes humidus]
MTDAITERSGLPILLCAPEGPPIRTPQDALDLIGATYAGADTVVLPIERLDPAFFTLSNGIAGEILQKFVNYHVRLVILGNVTNHGNAFRDLVHESNRGPHIWFLTDLEALDSRLQLSGK